MLAPLPRLEDYSISPATGFLPSEAPLKRLSDPVYERWETIIDNLQSLIMQRKLRPVVDKLPVIPPTHLYNDREWRRAYVVLSFLANGYIWGGEKPAEKLPPCITYPLLQVCEHVELPPVATFAGFCLWNWQLLFKREKLSLENLAAHTTFTGAMDEQWFFLVSVAIEAKGGSTIPVMLKAMQAVRDDDRDFVVQALQTLAEAIDEIGSLLVRMYDNCDPWFFYNRLRPFLAGSKNMQDAGLPNGVFYDDGTKKSSWRHYGGGSNAQSSLLQFFDIVLGVEHRPTGTKAEDTSASETESGTSPQLRHGFIHEMRDYMPGPHRRFLQAIEGVANIREYVETNQMDRELTVSYDACLAMLRSMRDKHLQIVSRYIIIQTRKTRSVSRPRRDNLNDGPRGVPLSPPPTRGRGIASVSYKNFEDQTRKKMRGTGGTALIPFLKQTRDETGERIINDWARSSQRRTTHVDREIEADRLRPGIDDPDGEDAIVGLAGNWDLSDFGGGLCGY